MGQLSRVDSCAAKLPRNKAGGVGRGFSMLGSRHACQTVLRQQLLVSENNPLGSRHACQTVLRQQLLVSENNPEQSRAYLTGSL
jgi:hypothetical protein